LQHLKAELAEGMIDHRAHRLGGVAVAPIGRAQPVPELQAILTRIDAAYSDQGAVENDCKCHAAVLTVRRRDELLGVIGAVGMGNAGGVLRHAAIAGETNDRGNVAAAWGAQRQPLGLEQRHTALVCLLRRSRP
jgi:hypothetical protein